MIRANKNWTSKEIEYLSEEWGRLRPTTIAKKLNRSEGAVVQKATKIGLGPFLNASEYITLNQLIIAFTGTRAGYTYKTKSWVEERGLPVHLKAYRKNHWRIVYLDEFWEWAEKNKSFLDFSKMEKHALGAEPAWVDKQRRLDSRAKLKKEPWTRLEDERLKMLLKQYKYSWTELSHELNRSVGAIQRRITDLKIKERPLKAYNHNNWSKDEFKILADMIRDGFSYSQIADIIGRSEKAIRGRVYETYWTENADKVRIMLQDGEWGYGKSEPTVKQTKYKYKTKKLIGEFSKLLRIRMNELGYEPYWQKEMCLHWDNIKGCTANENNCDSCISFKKIPPQFCVRCGTTFFERKQNKICFKCRKIRKWQAVKKANALKTNQ